MPSSPSRHWPAVGRPRARSRLRRGLAGVGLVCGALLAAAAPADAHALLRSSHPGDGATVDSPPESVTLRFTEEPEPDLTEVQILDSVGAPVTSGGATVVAGRPDTVRVAVRDLEDGVFTVTWRVVSRVDGHTTAGAFAFGVGVPAEDIPASRIEVPETPEPSPLELGGRFLLLLGLGLLVGCSSAALLAFPRPPRPVLLLAAAGWGAAAVGVVGVAGGQLAAADVGLGPFLGSTVGRAIWLRAAGVLLAGVALVAARSRPARARAALAGAALAALAAVLVHVGAGHAAAGSLPWAKVAAQWIHVAAAGVWLGGLAALLVAIHGLSSDEKVAAIRRFSAVAGVALFVVLATGVLRAASEVPFWGALLSSTYGRLVLAKLALLAVLAVLGARNRYRHVPAGEAGIGRLRRVSRVELTVGVLALAAAAVLASVAPRTQAEAGPGAIPGIRAAGTDFAQTVRVRLSTVPGSAGANGFTVRLEDPTTGNAVDAQRVALEFAYLGVAEVGTSVLELERAEPGVFRGEGANLSLAGTWEVRVLVQRTTDSVEVRLVLGTECGGMRVPGDPPLWNLDTALGSAQGYLDPGTPGQNEVHITYFDEAGQELVIDQVSMVAAGSGEDRMALRPRRLTPGHFVATADLDVGSWRFDISAAGPGGTELPVCFEEDVE